MSSQGFPEAWCAAAGVAAERVLHLSTGIIGTRLPLDRVAAGVTSNILALTTADPGLASAAEALRMADEKGLAGKEVTPFLLQTIVGLTGGDSLAVNLLIAENNIRVAGEIALSWARR